MASQETVEKLVAAARFYSRCVFCTEEGSEDEELMKDDGNLARTALAAFEAEQASGSGYRVVVEPASKAGLLWISSRLVCGNDSLTDSYLGETKGASIGRLLAHFGAFAADYPGHVSGSLRAIADALDALGGEEVGGDTPRPLKKRGF